MFDEVRSEWHTNLAGCGIGSSDERQTLHSRRDAPLFQSNMGIFLLFVIEADGNTCGRGQHPGFSGRGLCGQENS